MAKDREGSVNIYGAMQAKTAQGIVAYTDGIAHENEDGTVINLDEMLKNGVGGGSAIVDVDELDYPGWSGTTVPNSGTVENVYFNTNLSVDEVVAILSTLTLNLDGLLEFLLYSNDKTIYVVKDGDFWAIGNSEEQYYFLSADVGMGFSGWNPDISYPIAINSEVSSEGDGASSGSQNSQLSSLFSTTPFVKGEEPKDDVFYRVAVSTQGGWSGNVVPNEGTVENIYFNTNLSVEEVYSLHNNLDLSLITNEGDTDRVYFPFMNSDGSQIIIVNYSTDGVLIIMYNDEEILFAYGEGILDNLGFEGWNPDFNGVVEIGDVNVTDTPYYNDLLSSLFSTTPFEYIEGEKKYDIYSYKNGEYKKVLQYGDIGSQESKEIDKTIVLTDISELGQIEYGSYSLTLTSEEFNQLINLEKNSINVIFDVSSIEQFASAGINFLYTKVYFQSVSIEGLRLYGINNYKKIYNFLFTSSSLTSTGSTDGVTPVYDLTLEANGVRVYSKNESGVSTNKLLSFSPPSVGGNQLISNGQVYTALQSYAKTSEVNQMIADYITTNFENFNEGEF